MSGGPQSHLECPEFIEGGDFQTLLEKEQTIIQERRAAAFKDYERDKPLNDLVGLGLSGGGLRSAAYNLGFIQALSRFGLLRYVDYLCSVSGGGYIAGHVSAAATRTPGDGELQSFHDSPEARFGLDANERLEPRLYRFRHLGEYLLNYGSFLWRYVVSTIGTLLLFTSLLGIIATILALIWRSHDTYLVREYRKVTGLNNIAMWFGFGGETFSAFLPSAVLFGIFLGTALLRHICFHGKRPPRWLRDDGRKDRPIWETPIVYLLQFVTFLSVGYAILLIAFPQRVLTALTSDVIPFQVLLIVSPFIAGVLGHATFALFRLFDGSAVHGALWVALISVGVSLAVFLGNGESPIGATGENLELQSHWTSVILVSTIVSLLPLVATEGLARSAQTDAPRWKQCMFSTLLGGATAFAPFFMVHWMARENFSGFASHRDSRILVDDVKNWDAFLALFQPPVADQENWLAEAVLGFSKGRYPVATASEEGPLWTALDVPRQEAVRLRFPGPSFGRLRTHQRDVTRSTELLAGESTWQKYEQTPVISPLSGTRNFLSVHIGLGEEGRPAVLGHLIKFRKLRTEQEEFLRAALDPYLDVTSEDQVVNLDHPRFTARLMELVVLQAAESGGDSDTLSLSAESIGDSTIARRRDVEKFTADRASQMKEGKIFKELWRQATLHSTHDTVNVDEAFNDFPWTEAQYATFDRLLLECLFPDILRERKFVSTHIVPDKDQLYRLYWLGAWAAMFAFAMFCIDYNRWSPFYSYYRDRLHEHCVAVFDQPDRDAPPDTDRAPLPLRLGNVAPWTRGAPYPLMLASQFFFRRVRSGAAPASEGPSRHSADGGAWTNDATLTADSSRLQPFIFSPLYCGGPAAGYRRTKSYCGGHVALADAMAISGAALTPFMVDNLFFSALMAAFNLRIGQWLPSPKNIVCTQPGIVARGYQIAQQLLLSAFDGKRYDEQWNLTLIADGGFHDFFGLEELLLRRCRIIILSDAGCNNGRFEFGALADVIRLVRERHGIQILDLDNDTPADLSYLRRKDSLQPLQHICLRVVYPPKRNADGEADSNSSTLGLLVYSQMSLTGREPLDLQQFRKSHPNFPDEPITNQFFDTKQVESYRQLGYAVGRTICRQMQREIAPDEISAPFQSIHQEASGDPRPTRRKIGEIGQELVRGYLAELAAVQKQRDSEQDRTSSKQTRVVDLFGGRKRWAWPVLSLGWEDVASAYISAYFSGAHSNPRVIAQLALHIDAEEERGRALALGETAVRFLELHRQQVGHPEAAPFRAGGRRVLLRALATILESKNIVGEEEGRVFSEINNTASVAHAWFALAHLVVKEFGVETTSKLFLEVHKGTPNGTMIPPDRLCELCTALTVGDATALLTLWERPSLGSTAKRRQAKS